MPFFLILAILIAYAIPGPFLLTSAPPSFRFSVAAAVTALIVVLARGIAQVTCSLLRSSPTHRWTIVRAYRWSLRVHRTLLLIAYAVVIHVLGWHDLVETTFRWKASFLAEELLLLFPFLATVVLSWAVFYDVDGALRESAGVLTAPWSRGQYVSFHVRHELAVVLVPFTVLFAVRDVLRWTRPDFAHESLVLLGALGLVFLLFPVFLRVLWNARPFPCGPMRDRLLAFGARFGRGMNHVLLWNTHRQIANAVVAGFVPRFRVVLLSDGLVENLNEEEVEAVLGHEAGHVVHRHMLLRLLWVLALTLAFCLAYDLGDAVLKAHPLLAPGPGWRLAGGSLLLLTATALFGLLFGRFCRRLERQADVFACRSTSCGHPDCTPHDHRTRRASGSGPLFSFICPTSIETYQSSLEKLARLNGVEPTSPSWQHPSIAQRVADLERFKRNPQLERRPPHSLRRLGAIELLILGGTLLGYFLFSH